LDGWWVGVIGGAEGERGVSAVGELDDDLGDGSFSEADNGYLLSVERMMRMGDGDALCRGVTRWFRYVTKRSVIRLDCPQCFCGNRVRFRKGLSKVGSVL